MRERGKAWKSVEQRQIGRFLQRNYLGKVGWEILRDHSEELIEVNRESIYSTITLTARIKIKLSLFAIRLTNFLIHYQYMSFLSSAPT